MIPEFKTTIISIEDVARNTKKIHFTLPKNYNFKAGQFLSMKFTEKSWRAYSIASTPNEEYLELLIRLVENGVGSMVLKNSNIGDEFIIRGPFGHFSLSKNKQKNLIFCGTGTGIAPFKAMIKSEAKKLNPRPMSLYYGGRDSRDIAYLDEIQTWAPNLKIFLGFSKNIPPLPIPNTIIQNSRITVFLENTNFDLKNTEFYICGNGSMVMSIREILDKKGVSKEQIFQERFN